MSEPKDAAKSGAKKPSTSEAIELGLIRSLAAILKETDLTEIEVERGDLRIRVARGGTAPTTYLTAPAAPTAAAPVAHAGEAAAPAAPPVRAGDLVKSPMVGTVYHQATPGSDPFIKVGDKVAEGQTRMIVEAMKTMNPIPSPRAGVVVEVLVADGQPVEFGEPLVVLE